MASEAQHQAYVIKWSQQPSIRRQWPELALLHHIPNGGTRDAVEAKHLKQQGVKSGVPDLCLPVPRGQYHGLYIEMKPANSACSGCRLAGGGSSPGMVFAVMSTGFTFPWEKAAMHGEELPEGLSLPDQMAYTCLRNIYFLYYNKTISRDQAAAEKQRVRVQWERAASAAEFERKLSEHHARVIRETEAAKTACRKDPTAENALRLCNVMDGLTHE